MKLDKHVVKFVSVRWMRSNVLLCRAIARIGEVPQAEGFVVESLEFRVEGRQVGVCWF